MNSESSGEAKQVLLNAAGERIEAEVMAIILKITETSNFTKRSTIPIFGETNIEARKKKITYRGKQMGQ